MVGRRAGLALAGLEPALGLVDDIDAAFAAHDPTVAMPIFQGPQRVSALHRFIPSSRLLRRRRIFGAALSRVAFMAWWAILGSNQ